MAGPELRSRNWFGKKDLDGFTHRSWLKAEGWSDQMFDGRPVIGIANSWSELTNCNSHLRQVAEAVKRGVLSAGGFPLEFPTISLGEILMKPTTMMFRNLMAMDVEECIRAYPLDGVVLLTGCDKTTPAMLMGAASADVPAIMVTGGPMLRGMWGQVELGSGTDNWRYWAELRAGRISEEEWCEIELDVPNRRLTLRVSDEELARRRALWTPRPPHYTRGYGKLFLDHVLQAHEGMDFDFLRGRTPVRAEDTAGPSHS